MTPSIELPLVFFTTLSQMAIGLTLVYALRTAVSPGPVDGSARMQWLGAAGLVGLSLLIALTHLGHPEGAPFAVVHLSTAWLSREALLFGVLAGVMGVTALMNVGKKLVLLSAALGLLGLFVQGMVYAPPSFPAVNNALPFAFFLVTAIVLGTGASCWFTPQNEQPFLRRLLVGALSAGLLLFLVVPFVWLSGGTIMNLTGQAYLASPFFWAHIALGLAVPLAVVLLARRIPFWLPFLMLAGALCGRCAFYLDTIHSAANIGGLY